MTVVLDTPLLATDDPTQLARLLDDAVGDEPRAVSVISISELLQAARLHVNHRARRLAYVEHLVAILEPIAITTTVARIQAELALDVGRRGVKLAPSELWIAASALTYGFGVVAGNDDYAVVGGLRTIAV